MQVRCCATFWSICTPDLRRAVQDRSKTHPSATQHLQLGSNLDRIFCWSGLADCRLRPCNAGVLQHGEHGCGSGDGDAILDRGCDVVAVQASRQARTYGRAPNRANNRTNDTERQAG